MSFAASTASCRLSIRACDCASCFLVSMNSFCQSGAMTLYFAGGVCQYIGRCTNSTVSHFWDLSLVCNRILQHSSSRSEAGIPLLHLYKSPGF